MVDDAETAAEPDAAPRRGRTFAIAFVSAEVFVGFFTLTMLTGVLEPSLESGNGEAVTAMILFAPFCGALAAAVAFLDRIPGIRIAVVTIFGAIITAGTWLLSMLLHVSGQQDSVH